MAIPFDNRYAALGEGFFMRTRPTPVPAPALIRFNHELALDLGMDPERMEPEYVARIFSGNEIPEGAEPLAMAYAGHQFGFFTPQLGDGRAILLGEVTGRDGRGYEIHLKGSGRTVFSRNGDGRAPLGPVLREYLVSEAMHRLGVPTTRALAAVTTGEGVFRDRVLPGAVLTRVAGSFVRVGTFEFHARRGDVEAVRKLADHVIGRNYPELAQSDNRYLALLEAVVGRQASLVAKWMGLGFIHGVMNTDNMSILGETIDYGPCAFMDCFDFDRVYSSIDQHGRYAYSNQPGVGLWNLARLAECLALIVDPDMEAAIESVKNILGGFMPAYESAWLEGMRAKCGLFRTDGAAGRPDRRVVDDLLALMAKSGADFTLTFFLLSSLRDRPAAGDEKFLEQFGPMADPVRKWLEEWRAALARQSVGEKRRQEEMRRVNPVYIPRNHLVEAAIRSAEEDDDYSAFHELHEVLQIPYELKRGKERFQLPPVPEEEVRQTFCGT